MSPFSRQSSVRPIRPGESGRLTLDAELTVPVSFVDGGDDLLLVLLGDPGSALDEPVAGLVLESWTSRGLTRVRGSAQRITGSLVRFHVDGRPLVVQRRQFVRIVAPQPVTVDDLCGWVKNTTSLNISGGGMLLSGPPDLDLHPEFRFAVSLDDGARPVIGLGRVVRAEPALKRAVAFEDISPSDRQRVIRFVFDLQRTALAVTRGDTV